MPDWNGWGDEIRQRRNKPLEPDKYEGLRIILAQPEVLPCYFDNTIEFWAERISLWGALRIKHTDIYPKHSMSLTKAEMLQFLTDEETECAFGQWNVEKINYKSLVFKRNYIDAEGNRHGERIWIDIDLKPEIKRGMGF